MTEPLGNGGSPLPETFEKWVCRMLKNRIEPEWVWPLIVITLVVVGIVGYCIVQTYGG